MYFFKFINWFWTKELKDGESRFFFVLYGIILGLGPITVAAWFFGAYLYLWYGAIILSLIFLAIAYVYIAGIHAAYMKWQSQVFDKLRQ